MFCKRVGFRPKSELAHSVYNQSLGVAFLIFLSPVLAVICLLLLVTQGKSIFYRGARLGRGGRTFYIYKFRTLDFKAARSITRDKTLPPNSGIETLLGKVLRANRLDELPQVLNIVRGDMNICGPRPVRHEIATIEEKRIPGYNMRFQVKPGLIGPTQAYLGHGTSKKIRARLNYIYCNRPVSYSAEIRLMAEVGGAMVRKVALDVLKALRTATGLRSGADASSARLVDMWAWIEGVDQPLQVNCLGQHTIELDGLPYSNENRRATLFVGLRNGAVRKASILLTASEKTEALSYTALTEVGEFVIERYGLGLVVVAPPLRFVRAARKPWAAVFGRSATPVVPRSAPPAFERISNEVSAR